MSCTANESTFSVSASSPVELLCTSLHFMGDAQNKVLPFQLSVPALNYLRLTKKKKKKFLSISIEFLILSCKF